MRPRKPLATNHSPRATVLPILLLSLATSHSPLYAQVGSATLTGTVSDQSGALLPNAVVRVINEDTGVTVRTETTRAGVYDVEALNPGRYRVIVGQDNESWSKYEALQVQDQGYLAPGLQVVASYTFSQATDNPSSDFLQTAPLAGNSNFDVRQTFNFASTYDIPGAKNTGVLRYASNGWHLDSRFTALSGYPVSVIQSSYFLPNGESAYSVPDRIPGEPVYLHHQQGSLGGWALNKDAFACVPTQITNSCYGTPIREGNVGRNTIQGPAFWNINAAVQRDFAVYDRMKLVFRLDAFNPLNHPNSGNIVRFLTSSTFGESEEQATVGAGNPLYATGSPRSLQFALKLQF